MIRKLVLLRDGESEWNKMNLYTGWADSDLSEKGRKEAGLAGQTLMNEGYDFDICYTSYLKRAITISKTRRSLKLKWKLLQNRAKSGSDRTYAVSGKEVHCR